MLGCEVLKEVTIHLFVLLQVIEMGSSNCESIREEAVPTWVEGACADP
jgi:hypothetical protein